MKSMVSFQVNRRSTPSLFEAISESADQSEYEPSTAMSSGVCASTNPPRREAKKIDTMNTAFERIATACHDRLKGFIAWSGA